MFRRSFARPVCACLAVLALAACSGHSADHKPQVTATRAEPMNAAAPNSLDGQLAGFAAVASTGQSDVVTDAASGATVRVTVVKDYYSASGRNCRKLMLRPGGERTACQALSGSWHMTRNISGRRGL